MIVHRLCLNDKYILSHSCNLIKKIVVLQFDLFDCHKLSRLAEIEPKPGQNTSGVEALVSIVVETTSMLGSTNRTGIKLITEQNILFVGNLEKND